MDRITRVLKAIDRLETRVHKGTQYAESRCSAVELTLHSDMSCHLTFKWIQHAPEERGVCRSRMDKALDNLLATIQAGPEMAETYEPFDSLDDLENYLGEQGVL